MNILVTGGAGYIGSHVCKCLAAKGHLPVAYDNLCRGHRAAVKWGPLELGDIAEQDRLRTVLEQYHPAAVMHFAALAYVGESVERPIMYYCNNVAGTTVLLQTLTDLWRVPFIFSSSCVTYGIPERVPITEDHPQRPINPYGFSKLVVERMLFDIGRISGLPWISLRYFNASGADPSGDIGEMHDPEPHLIPNVLAAARDGRAVSINGTDYDTLDGTCVRDYVHVLDIADAHIRALDYLIAKGESCSLNLANSKGYSVKEVIATAERVCGRSISANTAPRRPGDPPILIGEADRARNLLGWTPTRSDLEIQIADAWNWMCSQCNPLRKPDKNVAGAGEWRKSDG
jgi:UDP-glucose-4-epimerase GalE